MPHSPDASLLLRGIDTATSGLLSGNPMVGFRVSAYRHSIALDFNPTVAGGPLSWLGLLQAESEAISLVEATTGGDKKARSAALGVNRDQPPLPKSGP